jgi:IPT/TIG domain-containing protein/HYR domain-containing protein
VTFTTTAIDDCDPSPSISCVPPSGSTFALGSRTVNCSAADHSGNGSACSFTVTVRDTINPTITCSPNLTVECTSPSGAVVSYSTTASDVCDSTPTLVCSPASGTTFALGVRTVNCTATDHSGNASSCAFTVTVRDTTPPALNCPGGVSVPATSSSGAIATFSVSASDVCDPSPTLACNPPSGSTFPLGRTTVTCNSADAAGNIGHCSFDVFVTPGITSVLPRSGKETGGDLVNIFGAGFTTPGDTTVLFGGAAASIVSVTPSHIQVRTPANFGTVNVVVNNSFGATVAPNAYTYLDDALAARLGNVNVNLGDRVDVLTLNGSIGDANREITIAPHAAIRVDMATSPSRPSSRYALYVWAGAPNAGTLSLESLAGHDLGCMVFPSPLNVPDVPQPRKIFNNTGIPDFGTANLNSFPAPVTVGQRLNGLGGPRTLTLQGFIQDDGSQNTATNYSITNAIVLHVGP